MGAHWSAASRHLIQFQSKMRLKKFNMIGVRWLTAIKGVRPYSFVLYLRKRKSSDVICILYASLLWLLLLLPRRSPTRQFTSANVYLLSLPKNLFFSQINFYLIQSILFVASIWSYGGCRSKLKFWLDFWCYFGNIGSILFYRSMWTSRLWCGTIEVIGHSRICLSGRS